MSNYYYLGTALPDLKIGEPAEISFSNLMFCYQQNLAPQDFQKVQAIRLIFDIDNLRSFWLKESLDPRGFYDENELEEIVLSGSGFPSYVYDFLEQQKDLSDRLHHFPSLVAQYFREEVTYADGFLKEYLSFERGLRLVLVAFRAKKLNRDIFNELQYESPEDPLIAQILSQKDAKQYEPPEQYEHVKQIFNEFADDPAALNKALVEYRFKKIDELTGLQVFTIDALLAYFVKFIMVEKWQEQDHEKGVQLIKKIIQEPSNE
ncbi:Uncharacterized protein PHSC3_000026 [Chlamydiales bacterium STE3]|nr:Uncharacterized protein PHSC3_000026 [Chlamydiales bacterium STE3]